MPGPEQTFRSPNFYDREIDQTQPVTVSPVGVPAGIIATANRGPAFVPVTVGTMPEFVATFGNLDTKRFGPYAVNEFMKHRTALTFMRVLGAGSNTSDADVATTLAQGTVKNAGFHLDGNIVSTTADARHAGAVQFICAQHNLSAQDAYGGAMFTDNDSFVGTAGATTALNLVRGMVLMASGARLMVLNGQVAASSSVASFATTTNILDVATVETTYGGVPGVAGGVFKLVISSTLGNAFANVDSNPGVQIYTASLNPTDPNYYAKILNTDPDQFVARQHLLFADFPVDAELVTASYVAVLSGSASGSASSGAGSSFTFLKMFGAFNTRYQTPASPAVISQPFGATEYDLFSFEAVDDGDFANNLVKVSITNILASTDDSNQYGTFTVQVRDFNDTDNTPRVLEQFSNCSLNPQATNYVGKMIGDRKVTFNFDTSVASEKRLVTFGKYPTLSRYIRVKMADAVERAITPPLALPFGFRGLELPRTNDLLNNTSPGVGNQRLAGQLGISAGSSLTGSILPPVPFRFKVTKGAVDGGVTSPGWLGQPGSAELTFAGLYWGAKFERNNLPLNQNLSSEPNLLLKNYTKFLGVRKLDALVTGSGADTFNNNKFTLARVALSNGAIADLTASVNDHMKETAYVRNGKPDTTVYTVSDGILNNRMTFATLLKSGGSAVFNRFSSFAKFTLFLKGGFDGVNILDSNARRLNDKSTSFDTTGGAEPNYISPGFLANLNGVGQANSTVMSYQSAIDAMTDPMAVNTNILVIPGIREPFVTDYAGLKVKNYGLAFYVMDIPSYDDNLNRLYDDAAVRPSIDQTCNQLDARVIDNSYAGTYFPDVFINDLTNKRIVRVPASVAALGALAFNDRVAYPWFAPAGFNRAALDFVTNVVVRLNVTDRDRLQTSRINPIATFPKLGFVIYGQRTLQIAKSALDRVNVRRLILEVKRIVTDVAIRLDFEQNTPAVRNKFVADSVTRLGLIQSQAGIETFQVVCNETNNSNDDAQQLRMNGRVVVVPTKTIEFIAIDFVITNAGVLFV